MSNVVELETGEVGDGYVLNIDDLLEAAKGANLSDVVIIGTDDDGELYVASSHGRAEAMMLLAFAQHWFCREALGD